MKNDDIASFGRHNALQRLRQSRRSWWALAERASVGLYLADEHGRLLGANQAFARMLGWDDAPTR